VVFFEITGAVGAENDSAIGQINAGEVVERAVGKLFKIADVNVDLLLMNPIFAVAAHGEENFLAVEGGLRLEHRPGLQMSQAREFPVRPGRNQGIKIPAGPDGSHGALGLVISGAAGVDVTIAPVVGALINPHAAVGFFIEDGRSDKNDAGKTVVFFGAGSVSDGSLIAGVAGSEGNQPPKKNAQDWSGKVQ
jgi:hypothetical protein